MSSQHIQCPNLNSAQDRFYTDGKQGLSQSWQALDPGHCARCIDRPCLALGISNDAFPFPVDRPHHDQYPDTSAQSAFTYAPQSVQPQLTGLESSGVSRSKDLLAAADLIAFEGDSAWTTAEAGAASSHAQSAFHAPRRAGPRFTVYAMPDQNYTSVPTPAAQSSWTNSRFQAHHQQHSFPSHTSGATHVSNAAKKTVEAKH